MIVLQGYNIITQRDSRVLVRMGEATQSDSTAMKTIAVVTTAFLPATFLSVSLDLVCILFKLHAKPVKSFFSMSFFNFAPADRAHLDGWSVSGKIWIY